MDPLVAQDQPLLQLIDEEEWFNLYGLRQAGDDATDGATANANDRETANRVAAESLYQNAVHAKIFAEDELDEKASVSQNNKRRSDQLKQWKTETIDIFTAARFQTLEGGDIYENKDGNAGDNEGCQQSVGGDFERVVIRTNLKDLASHSDLVFAMASNQHLFETVNTNCHDQSNSNNGTSGRLSLSLRDYSTESVKEFLKALLSSPPLQEEKQHCQKPTNVIPPEFVIDCCRLAHYLQCQQFLEFVVDEYLMTSIDIENCRFLCKLADELSLPKLWEASVNHMLSSLDKFDEDNEKIGNDKRLFEDLSPALKAEIQALRGILRSSNRKTVYFSTYHEYLGLLAEQHQYYKERLEDAVQGLNIRMAEEERLRQQLSALQAEKRANGRYQNTRLDRSIETSANRLEGLVNGRKYAASKIERQRTKVDTLKALWKEQEKVFGGGSVDDNAATDSYCPKFERRTQ